MKEMMIPYILIVWSLFATGALKKNFKNYTWAAIGGVIILAVLAVISRLWAPVDLTNSTTVKAPHAVMSPIFGQQIDKVLVDHNQMVKEGDIIYTLVDIDSAADKAKIESSIVQKEEEIKQMTRDLERAETSPEIFNMRDVEKYDSDLRVLHAELVSLKADLQKVNWAQEKKTIRAEFDGQVSIVNIAEGSVMGNMHLYNTSKKFLEMRISDQTYGYVQVGDFAEFFVDAYPGHVFRAKVHSFNAGTGESSISPLQGPQSVGQHVVRNGNALGRTIVLEIIEPEGYNIPIGSTGAAWISAEKPHPFWGFIDVIGAATVRLQSYKSYLGAW
ncbi:efflux RND transporter periplasmic adaptor subunit [Vibrio splendidus]|uniref:efflux RND transporter periplasmic adaptor subunit n=1 Tax=Vibrio splendidus TaxID=29497 RepID=UPI00080E9E6C|nr:biotin/lipoyl-binding protein [Vibrio splendidus]OCH61677.1 hemolysin D [Vibrio splendidus]